MKNDWDDYSDDFESNYEIDEKWEVRLNDETLDSFETKEEAIWFLLDDIDTLTNNQFFENIRLISYQDEEELYDALIDMCYDDFYEQLNAIYENFDIDDKYKLINLDNEEPEFGEL